jgi:exonuclease III
LEPEIVRTLYATDVMKIVTSAIEKYKIDIVAIQELRWTGVENIKLKYSTIVYSCGDKYEYGVGFIVKNDRLSRIKRFKACNERLCLLHIECKWINVTLINCYAPMEGK